MNFSISLEWTERVEASFVLDYADRPRYLGTDLFGHEYRIGAALTGKGFFLKLYENNRASPFDLDTFETQEQAKAAACVHAVKLIANTFDTLSKSRNHVQSLKIQVSELNETVEHLQGQVKEAETEAFEAASEIRERITLYSVKPVDALNEFLRAENVQEVVA